MICSPGKHTRNLDNYPNATKSFLNPCANIFVPYNTNITIPNIWQNPNEKSSSITNNIAMDSELDLLNKFQNSCNNISNRAFWAIADVPAKVMKNLQLKWVRSPLSPF